MHQAMASQKEQRRQRQGEKCVGDLRAANPKWCDVAATPDWMTAFTLYLMSTAVVFNDLFCLMWTIF